MPLRRTVRNNCEKRAYRFFGMPDTAQQIQINKTFGCVRYLYNHMLADKRTQYSVCGESDIPTPAWYKHISCSRWLDDVDSLALANTQIALDTAFARFFNHKAGYPAFKKKSDHHDSYTTNTVGRNIRYHAKKKTLWLTLPKVPGEIKIVMHRPIETGGKLKSVTVSREPDGKYYFSLLFEYPHKEPDYEIDPSNAVGLDMTMHGLYMDSDGHAFEYGNYYRKDEDRIAREQRKLSHMQKGSQNYRKQRVKIAKLYAKTKHQRSDTLHKESRRLVDTYDIIGIEDLNMQGMSQSLNFGKTAGDKGWGMFTAMLSCKAARAGKKVIKVSRFFPSSQMCHECGCLNKITKDLSVREVRCPHCGAHYNRDKNAAVNIREEAVRIYCTA